MAAYQRGGWDGIGRIHLPEDDLTGIDGDHCRDPLSGALEPWARELVRGFDSYAEVSPSGCGLRVFAHGTKPSCSHSRKGQVEVYDGRTSAGEPGGRYLTLTGHRLDGARADVERRPEAIAALCHRLWPPKAARASGQAAANGRERRADETADGLADDELLARARGAANGAKLKALFDAGDTSLHDGDASRADLALCVMLAFWTEKDADRMDRLFRRSALFRPKWDERRGDRTYGQRTLDEALELCAEVYTPRANPAPCRGGAKQTAAALILDHFRRQYRPDFRRGSLVHCPDGREVSMAEACTTPTSALIDRLALATDAPEFKGGGVNRDALPAFFARWAKVAWGDLLALLSDEDEAELGGDDAAPEEFRQMVKDALLSEVVLGDTIGKGVNAVLQTERRSLIDWCVKLAKPGPWRTIRSKKCWCKTREVEGGELVLMVAVRHELFAQLKADRRLCAMGPKRFARRAARYGVGHALPEDRPHGIRAIILDASFVADLTAALPEDDAQKTDG